MKMFGLVSLFVMVAGLFSSTARAELKVGDQAPDFELKGSDGKTYKLSDFKDKQAVVIAWFPKADTPGCTKECQSMRTNGEKLRKFDVAYFTASVDEPEANAKFSKKLELDYPILSDPTKKTAEAFGVVNSSRAVAQRWTYYIGKDGKVLYVDRDVKTASHGEDIAAKLKELGVATK
jgi:peroxiredoxin Q/BCP